MDFEFFENLSTEDAETYLRRFLEVESTEIKRTLEEARQDNLPTDYSVASIPPLFAWITPRVGLQEVKDVGDIPEWIASTTKDGFTELMDESKPLVLRAAYYLGETFVRTYPHLTWDIGNADFAHQQQPSVVGFRRQMELPVLLVTENTFLNALESDEPQAEFTNLVNAWTARA